VTLDRVTLRSRIDCSRQLGSLLECRRQIALAALPRKAILTGQEDIDMRRIVLLPLVVLSAPGIAEQVTPTPPIAPAAAVATSASKKPKMICRNDPEIGSLFVKKTCMSAEQWDRNAREGRMELEHSTTVMAGKVGGP
jgi:hypothetical protein